jgi:plasmid stabilization system protein ParE
MARGVVWSPEAIEDIESIASYIERDSAWYARAVASKIVETAETIPRYPELGRIVPEIGDASIRERFVYSYRIIYRLDAERILIAAVIHGSRLLQPFIPRIEGEQKSNP